MKAGISGGNPAWLVNQLCGSGLRAVAIGYQRSGTAMPQYSSPAVRNR